MNDRTNGICRFLSLVLSILAIPLESKASNLLINGNFEAAPILGPGQSGVPAGSVKNIVLRPDISGYTSNISGIQGWTYATPFFDGGHSDHGLATRNGSFSPPSGGQSAFINNWNRMMSQTVAANVGVGDSVSASVDYGTLGSPTDAGRAGIFYLVAGEANPANPDVFSARSIILGQLTVANPQWTRFTPDVTVDDGIYKRLNLSYTYSANDPALGLPLTIAFRTVTFSVGMNYWDNAILGIRQVPELGGLSAILSGSICIGGLRFARRRWTVITNRSA